MQSTTIGNDCRQFLICDSCYWCASIVKFLPNFLKRCPNCKNDMLESIPIAQDETFRFDHNAKTGTTLEFAWRMWILGSAFMDGKYCRSGRHRDLMWQRTERGRVLIRKGPQTHSSRQDRDTRRDCKCGWISCIRKGKLLAQRFLRMVEWLSGFWP